ncbi:hypothetical protein LJ655_11300 [Paraburkholderia sp. MMS20-SJTN17]|uniref:Uncharacterized protein n=1 Tax=Paraburkholderia translucens TaxID=2886945 RepID=A0ABS8KCI1_9BURK|nr:hypothetical protein [Paraburkholderia sp. MMS20-SJTN17]MCC8402469.1 hypothetical protein [Paraburkholderia sp. MMS20-SJTN17]
MEQRRSHSGSGLLMRRLFALLLVTPVICLARPPGLPCTSWPVSMAEATLQNAGLVKAGEFDESRIKTTPISIEKVGKDLYKQVFDIVLHSRSGRDFHVITVNTASSTECSMSGVDVYLIDRKFSGDAP